MQYTGDASQKLTSPEVSAEPSDVTVAVKVTAVPDPTVVTPLPPDVAASMVTVGIEDDHAAKQPPEASRKIAKMGIRRCMIECLINVHSMASLLAGPCFSKPK